MKVRKNKTIKHVGVKVGGFFGEFKTFILRGNVLDLAVGVIIGGAFQKIVTALVSDILMPLISLMTPKALDLSGLFFALDGEKYDTLAQAKAAGAAVLVYGSFLTMVLDFVLMAASVFFLIKAINALSKVRRKDSGNVILPETKTCPYCKSAINILATRCPNCTSHLVDEE
jgi:large conductance mechanosensitive channel